MPETPNNRSPHLANITLDYPRQWTITLPCVYRYENKEHIDEFFDTGRLRLSSFAQFSKYPDEHRGDSKEGAAISRGVTKTNEVWIVGQAAISALVFCASMCLDGDLMKKFQRDSVFSITDTPAFANAVARQLVGYRHGMEGHCIYRPERHIERDLNIDVNAVLEKRDLGVLPVLQNMIGGPEQLLLKEQRYQRQAEYRLLWEVDKLESEHVFVTAPDARNFCRRIDLNDVPSS